MILGWSAQGAVSGVVVQRAVSGGVIQGAVSAGVIKGAVSGCMIQGAVTGGIYIIIIIKTCSTGQSGKNKIVYKLLP